MNGEKGVVLHVLRLCAMLTLKKEEVDLRGRGEKLMKKKGGKRYLLPLCNSRTRLDRISLFFFLPMGQGAFSFDLCRTLLSHRSSLAVVVFYSSPSEFRCVKPHHSCGCFTSLHRIIISLCQTDLYVRCIQKLYGFLL